MLEKDKRRGLRRWWSHCVWTRRLKGDWATHGRQYNIYPLYDWKDGVRGKISGWRNDLCACFDLKNKEAIRFKDTPTGNESMAAYRKSDGWHDHREWETRNIKSDEMRSTRLCRRKREGMHPYRVCCHSCGFLIKIVQVKNGSWYRDAWSARCEGCAKKEKRRNTSTEDIKMPA